MFLVIPEEVAAGCSAPAALLYGRLLGLSQKEGYCWASNAYLAKLCKCGERTVRDWIYELRGAGFIAVEQELGGNRQIKPVVIPRQDFATPVAENRHPPRQNLATPPGNNPPPPWRDSATNKDNLTIQDDNYNSNHTSPSATPSERPPKKKAKQKSESEVFREAAAKLMHQPLVDRYATFRTERGGKIDLRSETERGALRNIKRYLTEVSLMEEPLAPPERIAQLSINGWAYILTNWKKLPPFHSNRITLANIYTDLTSIIDFHKNGRNQNQPTNGKPNPYAPIDTERLYNLTRHEAEQFVLHRDNAKRKD